MSGPAAGDPTGAERAPITLAAVDPAAVPAAEPESPAEPEVPWRRLSPGMLLVEPVRELIRFIPMLLVLLIAGSAGDGGPPWGLIGTAVVVALGVTRYLSTRFRITPTVVEVRRGLFQRKHLTVPRDRIRTIDVSAHPLQRLLGLVRADIGTGSSSAHAPSVRLDGVPASAVPGLRAELLHGPAGPSSAPRSGKDTGPADPAEVEMARFRPGWITLAPATLSGVVSGAILIGFGFRLMRQARLDPTRFAPVEQALGFLRGHSIWFDVALSAAVVVLVVVILSVAGYILSFWGFRLARHPGGTLQISRGLLTTRSTSIAERRLHGLQRREPLVLRWAHGARLNAVATGLRRGGEENGGGNAVLMPPAPATEVLAVETAILGDERLVRAPLQPHGPAARRRRYTRAVAGAMLLMVLLAALTWWAGLPPPLYALWVAGVPAAVPLAADRYRNLGHAVIDGHLIVGLGSLHRRRTVLAIEGIIGVTVRQSVFQRRAGVTTLIVTTAAGAQHYDVPDLPEPVAIDLACILLPASAGLTVGTTMRLR